MIDYIKYFGRALILLGLPVLQIAGTSVWGGVGLLLHPVLWAVVLSVFYLSRQSQWWLVIVCGLVLDIYAVHFGENILALSAVILTLNFMFSRFLVHRNLVSMLTAGIAATVMYTLVSFVWQLFLSVASSGVMSIEWTAKLGVNFVIYNLIGLIMVNLLWIFIRKLFRS